MRQALLCLLLSITSASFGQMPGMGRPTPPSLPSQAPGSPASDAPTGATASDVVYGKVGKQKLQLDIYMPKDKPDAPRVAVLLVHGGGWIEGDKTAMAAMGRWLAHNGYVAFSIDYRLLDGEKNQWPAQLDDAQRAVRWIRANAEKYNIDPAHIGAFGHSAGAQIVSLLGEVETRENSDAELAKYSSRVQAVVDYSGPVDFLTLMHNDPEGDAFLMRFLGVSNRQGSAAWKAASPALNVHSDTAPFLIFHGTEDVDVQIAQAEEMNAALENAKVPVTFIRVEDVHTFATDSARHKMAVETVAFFNRTLK